MTLLTTRDVANQLGVTPRRILALIQAGRLPATKHGRDWFVDAADLEGVRVRTPGRPAAKHEGEGQ